ncbi:MAG: glycosyltransferase family 87 protein, partial [Vicinamibacterales bacterium]
AALWWVGSTVARRMGATTWGWRAFMVSFLVVGGYVVEELRFGNAHFFVVALMVFAYERVEAGKVVTPSLALALAIATKLTPLALLGYFAIRRRSAVCFTTVAMVGALVVLPAVVMGTAGNVRQLRAFATYAMEKVDEGDNYSLRGIVVRYLTPGLEDSSHIRANVADVPMSTVNAIWLVGLIGLGLASLAAVWRESTDPVARMLEFCIVVTGVVLASPHTQRRYYVALYVPVIALVTLWSHARPALDRRRILVGLLATAAPATLLPLVFGGHRLALIYEASSPYTFGAIVLFGILVAMTLSRKAGELPEHRIAQTTNAAGNLSVKVGV